MSTNDDTEQVLRQKLADAETVVGMQARALEKCWRPPPTPADLWDMVVSLADEVESRIVNGYSPTELTKEELRHRLVRAENHQETVRSLHRVFWHIFGRDEAERAKV